MTNLPGENIIMENKVLSDLNIQPVRCAVCGFKFTLDYFGWLFTERFRCASHKENKTK